MTSANFAAAQRRVLERRRLLEAEARARLADQQRTSRIDAAALQRLPSPLNRLSGSGLNIWNTVKGREGTRPHFRVGQVDSELLDEELLGLLNGQIGEALKYYGSHIRDDWASEIQLALRALLFKISIWDHNASYGAALQGLQYVDSRSKSLIPSPPTKWQKTLYGLFTVGGRYAWEKWENWLIDHENGYEEASDVRLFSRITNLVSTTHSVAAFASFLIFLVNGRYRTLIDRVLRIRLAPPSNQVSREVSFEYLNRQLVWHAFTEFLLFLLPLVGISRWRRWVSRAWKKTVAAVKASSAEDGDKPSEKQGQFAFLPERTCAICYNDQNPTATSEADILGASSGGIIGSAQTDITNPYETIPCGCIYCFVCVTEKLEAEEGEGWVCFRCGEIVKQCKPWNGDVLEEAPRSSTSAKVVGFAIADESVVEKETSNGAAFDTEHHDSVEHLPHIDADNDALDGSNMWSTIDKD
ncbi:putative peroxisome biosynthesis protein, partial [Talaromyces proteolyticus]